MKERIGISRSFALALVGLFLVTAVLIGFRVIQPTMAQGLREQQTASTGPGWEYKVVLLGPGANQILNDEVNGFGWEFLGTSSDYALFRRGVPDGQ
jgi:hypothetical protein